MGVVMARRACSGGRRKGNANTDYAGGHTPTPTYPNVTEVVPFTEFYSAEAYHQDYYRRNPLQPYCVVVVRPKVAKLRKALASKLRTAVNT